MAGGLSVVCQGLASSVPRPLPLWTLSDTCFSVPWANKSTVLMARDFSEKLWVVGSHEAARLGSEKAGRNVPRTTAVARIKQSGKAVCSSSVTRRGGDG